MLRIGQLRHRIQIEQRSGTQDPDYGSQLDTWAPLKSIWAYIEPMAAQEVFNTQNWTSTVTHMITIRYDAIFADTRIAAAYRATYAGRQFNIQGVINTDERNRVMVLAAAEGLNDG